MFNNHSRALGNKRPRHIQIGRLATVLCCLVASLAFASSANAAFQFTGFGLTPSTLQAAGHPNLKVNFNTDATAADQTGDDLKKIVLDLPAGMRLNPESVTPANTCTATKFASDTCPAASQIGTVSVAFKALGLNSSASGSVYKLTPDADSIMTFGIIVRPSGFAKIFLKSTRVLGSSKVRSGLGADYGITATFDSIPRTFVTTTNKAVNLTISQVALNWNAKSGSTQNGAYFTFNPTRCDAATSQAQLTSYLGVSITKTSSFTPTGCAAVPFAPTAVVSPTSKVAAKPTGYVATFGIPTADAAIQQSHIKSLETTLPVGTGLNFAAIGGVPATCTDDQLNTDTCPAGSQVGSASANEPFLPPTMTGSIYLISRTTSLSFGVVLRGARGVTASFKGSAYPVDVTGDGLADTVKTDLLNLPQVPFTSATLGFGALVIQPIAGCENPQTVKTVATGYSGASSTVTNSFNITDCPAIPDTTITSPVPGTTPNNPSFTFTSDVATATFECSIDGATYAGCTSPYTSAPLADGSHTFSVRAVNGPQTDPTPASQTFTITTPPAFNAALSGAVTTQQAAGHPDLTANVDITGTGDIKSLAVTLPVGLQGSAAAVPMCSQANPATCTAASAIGTQSVTATLDNAAVTTLVGTIYLTAPVNTQSAAGILVIFPGVMAVGADIRVVNNGNQQQFVFNTIPNTVGPNHIHITKISTTLNGMTGAPAHPLLTNPSLCTAPSFFTGNATPYSGAVSVLAPQPYIATGCATVPFTADAVQEFSNPVAEQTTGVKTTITMNAGDSALKNVQVIEPAAISPNFPSFGQQGDRCPAASAPTGTSLFNPAGCPAQSKVGTMTVQTQLLPIPLSGTVYLINKSPLPWLGVQLNSVNGVDIRLVGVTSLPQINGETRLATTFDALPDQNMTNIVLDLNGPTRAGIDGPLSGDILAVATPGDPACVPTASVDSTLSPITGTPATNVSHDVNFSGC